MLAKAPGQLREEANSGPVAMPFAMGSPRRQLLGCWRSADYQGSKRHFADYDAHPVYGTVAMPVCYGGCAALRQWKPGCSKSRLTI